MSLVYTFLRRYSPCANTIQMRGYVVRTELTLAGRGIKLNGMQGGIGKSLFTVHWVESISELEISLFSLYMPQFWYRSINVLPPFQKMAELWKSRLWNWGMKIIDDRRTWYDILPWPNSNNFEWKLAGHISPGHVVLVSLFVDQLSGLFLIFFGRPKKTLSSIRAFLFTLVPSMWFWSVSWSTNCPV